MAYFDQSKKKAIEPAIKAICKEYGVKATLSVKHSSSVVLNIASGNVDFSVENGYEQVNVFWVEKNYTGAAKEFLKRVLLILNIGNYNNSDSRSDYFDVGHHVGINIGKWNKPYQLTK